METNKFVEQIMELLVKIKKQDIDFGNYLEGHVVLDMEQDIALYYGKSLAELNHLPIIIK